MVRSRQILEEIFRGQKPSFFPIGDLHIENEEQSKIFTKYLNSREEDFIVLLGDVIHFANSFWNSRKGVSKEEIIKGIPVDVSIWEGFIKRLWKRTIFFRNTREVFTKIYKQAISRIYA
jgi:UDP-2,3-diacylglucosamine pyrophosphatase LpxH